MRKEVADFLREQDGIREDRRRKRREKHLIELGLCQSVPVAEGTGEEKDWYVGFDAGIGRVRQIPLEVTEEEYAAICERAPEEPVRKDWPVWPVHKILFVLAVVVYGAGLVLGLTVGASINSGYLVVNGVPAFSLSAALSVWFSAAVGGSVLLALSELDRLMKKSNGEV